MWGANRVGAGAVWRPRRLPRFPCCVRPLRLRPSPVLPLHFPNRLPASLRATESTGLRWQGTKALGWTCVCGQSGAPPGRKGTWAVQMRVQVSSVSTESRPEPWPGVSCCLAWHPHFAPWAMLFSGGSFVKHPQPWVEEVIIGLGLRSGSSPRCPTSRRKASWRARGWGGGGCCPSSGVPRRRADSLTPSLCSVRTAQRHGLGGSTACSSEPCISSGIQLPKSERRGAPRTPWPFVLVPGTCVVGPLPRPSASGPLLRGLPSWWSRCSLPPRRTAAPRFRPANPTAPRVPEAGLFPWRATAQGQSAAPITPEPLSPAFEPPPRLCGPARPHRSPPPALPAGLPSPGARPAPALCRLGRRVREKGPHGLSSPHPLL